MDGALVFLVRTEVFGGGAQGLIEDIAGKNGTDNDALGSSSWIRARESRPGSPAKTN